jgi:hypothetical protein
VRLVTRAPLVQDGEVRVQDLAQPFGGLDAASVGRHHDQVVAMQPELVLQISGQDRQCGQVSNGKSK